MLRSFHAELQKAHRRHDLLLCLLVPLIIDAYGWAGLLPLTLKNWPTVIVLCFTASRSSRPF